MSSTPYRLTLFLTVWITLFLLGINSQRSVSAGYTDDANNFACLSAGSSEITDLAVTATTQGWGLTNAARLTDRDSNTLWQYYGWATGYGYDGSHAIASVTLSFSETALKEIHLYVDQTDPAHYPAFYSLGDRASGVPATIEVAYWTGLAWETVGMINFDQSDDASWVRGYFDDGNVTTTAIRLTRNQPIENIFELRACSVDGGDGSTWGWVGG